MSDSKTAEPFTVETFERAVVKMDPRSALSQWSLVVSVRFSLRGIVALRLGLWLLKLGLAFMRMPVQVREEK